MIDLHAGSGVRCGAIIRTNEGLYLAYLIGVALVLFHAELIEIKS